MFENLPILKTYARYMRIARINIKPEIWLAFGLVASLITALLSFFILITYLPTVSPFLAFVLAIVALDLIWGYPYFQTQSIIDQVEKSFPSVLREMADILKAGGTYEYALREIKNTDYGPISKYFERIVRKLDEGGTLEQSLYSFANEIDSKIVKRTITIVVDSIKAGARLSQVLEEISEDARSIYKLGEERKTQTMLQTAFLMAAGTFVAPVIFGLVGTIVAVLLKSSTGLISTPSVLEQAAQAQSIVLTLFVIYIFISNIAVGAMVALMREGNLKKSLFFIPILLLISYIAYYLSGFFSAALLGV